MAEFLDAFDVERGALLKAVTRFEDVWGRFQERRGLQVDGDDVSDGLIAGELALVRRDLEQSKFTVGMFGLIKRGKSTLLNSLLGLEVSSMHVTPETAVPVYVDYGVPQADVYFADGTVKHVAVEEVERYTSQKYNENNHLGVLHVHQFVEVPFLRNGVRLVDTPGLDDAQADEVYTQRTLQELDAVDAGVVVFLSPPTVSATELNFLQEIAARQIRKVFLVCNMYPQHFYDPTTRGQVLSYVGNRIVEASRRVGVTGEVRLYPLCALDAWTARRDFDIDGFKASGAARLLRDIETFLSEQAGREVLVDAARRVAQAADLAKGEVGVRRRLLEDRDLLAAHRRRLDENVRDLERDFNTAVNSTLASIEPLQMRVRGQLLAPFGRAKQAVGELRTLEEVERFATRFRREVEVAGEVASRSFQSGFETTLDRLRRTLEQRFEAVMTDLTPSVPKVALNGRGFLLTPDQVQAARRNDDGGLTGAISGAAAGGVLSGGAAFALLGGVLGPLGMLAGALVGWKLGVVFGGSRGVERARQLLLERLEEVSRELTRDFDAQVALQLRSVRELVNRRRHLFAADLYHQFELVESLAEDSEKTDQYLRETERFASSFDACAQSALKITGLIKLPAALDAMV
ncbi:MAG TPA: dynamin family protein [Nitriliruptorales bacterium]|nr:dynamin family protein [Nitriliruptorales bacterium]